MTPQKPFSVGPFLGVNNRRRDNDLVSTERVKPGSYLKAAENVDINDSGRIKRRRGALKKISGTNCHSLWSDETNAFYADGANLFRINGKPVITSTTLLRSNLPLGRTLSYAHDGVDPIYTDGVVVQRIHATTVGNLAPPTPSPEPDAVGAAGGSFPAGLYQFLWTYRDAVGREGPATAGDQISVPANGKITFFNMPTSFPSGVSAMVLYLSPVNGTEKMRAGELTAAVATYTIAIPPALGGRILTELLAPIPAGDIVRFVNGRLHVAAGNLLFYSRPFAPGLYAPAEDFIPFPETITLLEIVPRAVYVGTASHTYFIEGDIAKAELKPLLPYGAVKGASGSLPNEESCWWMSTRGAVIGDKDGAVKNLQEDQIFFDQARVGAGLVREQEGARHLIASTFNATPSRTAVGSFMDATVG